MIRVYGYSYWEIVFPLTQIDFSWWALWLGYFVEEADACPPEVIEKFNCRLQR